MDVFAVLLSYIRIVLGFLLVFFIPGFLISFLYFPKVSDISIVERLAWSAVTSLGSVIACVLFMDVFLGIDTTPGNIVIVLAVLCLMVGVLIILQHILRLFSLSGRIAGLVRRVLVNPVRAVWDRLKNLAGNFFHRG